jgi:hypothetical protein
MAQKGRTSTLEAVLARQISRAVLYLDEIWQHHSEAADMDGTVLDCGRLGTP